jgi:hypothetical protein
MTEDNHKVLDHVDPARREFLKRLLAGAAFAAPVVATFSIDALTADPAYAFANTTNTTNIPNIAHCTADVGYVGPTQFQAHVSGGPGGLLGGQGRVNGEVTLNLVVSGQVVTAIHGTVTLVSGATITSVSIVAGPTLTKTVPVTGGAFTIQSANLDTTKVCDLDEVADLMASGEARFQVTGTEAGKNFTIAGMIIPVTSSQIA